MNKKLLTAAVGAALVAGPMLAAQAKVTVYGMVQFELASEDVDSVISGQNDNFIVRTNRWNGGGLNQPAGVTDGSALTLEDNQRGRFGIKSTEDLGNGLKGFVKIEYDISADGTANAQNSNFGAHPGIREANVGLKGSWGTFTIGTQKTPYKYWGGVKYDPFVTTNLEARRNGGMTGGAFGQNAFAQDAISYQTGKGTPVAVWVVYSPDEQGGASVGPGSANGWDDGDYSIGVKAGKKNWEVFAAVNKNKDNAVALPANDYDATKVGGMWKSGPHKIVAQYEDTSFDSAAGVTDDGNVLFVGYHLKFGGNNTLVVQFGDGELERNTSAIKQEWTYIAAGVIHKFSKKTRVFAGYSTTDMDNQGFTAANDGDRTVLSVGLRKDF